MVTENLSLMGLTKNEIKVYETILKEGKSSGTKIRQASKISNSQTYSAIDSLIGKGLITYEKHAKGRKYSAINPDIIKKLADEQRSKIEESIPFLKSLQSSTKEKTESGVFEGFEGFKKALIQLAEECPKNETINIIGFSNQAYKNEKLAYVLRDVNKISQKKKHKFRMILDDKENTFYEGRKEEGISEIKFMENGFKSPAAIDIFGNSVYILLWDENPYAFVIKNKSIADGFRAYFEFLWKIAKK